MNNYWKRQLNAFDAELCKMVESLTGEPCEPKNGGNHYFFEANYVHHRNDPQYILAIWDAIEGRLGQRLISMKDNADRSTIVVRARFHSGQCKDAAFIPKIEQE